MYQYTQDLDRIIKYRGDENLMSRIFRGIRRKMLTDIAVQTTCPLGWETARDPDVIRDRETISVENATHRSYCIVEPLLT
jgi:hypothetical protein